MGRILDCTNDQLLRESLCKILEVDALTLIRFLHKRRSNISIEDGQIKYNKVTLEDFYSEVERDRHAIDALQFDGIYVFHLTTIRNVDSIIQNGMFNLKQLFRMDNPLKSFLKIYNIDITVEDNELRVYHEERKVAATNSLYNIRLRKDHCVNGFLFYEAVESNGNVEHIKRSPEILQSIARVLKNKQIEKDWMNETFLAIVKFKACIKNVSGFSEDIEEGEVYRFLIEKAFEYLIYRSSIYWYGYELVDEFGMMVYMKDDINIPPCDIIEIIPVHNRYE